MINPFLNNEYKVVTYAIKNYEANCQKLLYTILQANRHILNVSNFSRLSSEENLIGLFSVFFVWEQN